MHAFTTLAALAAIVPAVLAGTATVNNNCDADVYLWVVLDGSSSEMHTLSAGDSYSEDYQTTSNGGVSIKCGLAETPVLVTQFEYTLSSETVFYDVSNIDGFPSMFMTNGLDLTPSDSSCTTVTCDAGVETCSEAYNLPNDTRTLACSADADLVMNLCTSSSSDNKTKRFVIPPQARHNHGHHARLA